jgi:hypothetical protein
LHQRTLSFQCLLKQTVGLVARSITNQIAQAM